jgi:NADH-quinone oxidoreductase E subunit
MALTFSERSNKQIQAVLAKYPNKMAATLPVLWITQEQFGHISAEAVELVARTLDVPPTQLHGVLTFYTMYNRKPVGRLHIQVCTNVSCMLRGAYEVLRAFEDKCGIKVGETTEDFTLQEVECLAACGTAPCVQINDRYYEPVVPAEVGELVDRVLGEARSKGVKSGGRLGPDAKVPIPPAGGAVAGGSR